MAALDPIGHQTAAGGFDHLGSGGQDGTGNAVPGTHTLGKDSHTAAGPDPAQGLDNGGGGHGALVADDGLEDEFEQFVGKAPAGDVLAGYEIHLPGEADGHQQGVIVRHMVGQNDVVFRQIPGFGPFVAEFDLQKTLDQGHEKMVEKFMFPIQDEHLRAGLFTNR